MSWRGVAKADMMDPERSEDIPQHRDRDGSGRFGKGSIELPRCTLRVESQDGAAANLFHMPAADHLGYEGLVTRKTLHATFQARGG